MLKILRKKEIVFLPIVVVYVFGMFVDIMDTDAAQYASIAREMIETGKYLYFKHRYADYLDKPPLLFWLSAWSMKLLGIHNFGYKLPSVLVGLLCIYSVYRLMNLWYNEEIAYWSALFLATTETFFLIQNDIRTDTLQIGFTLFALWQLVALEKTKKPIYILGAGVAIGCAMLAKGPMGIMLPVLALGTDVLRKAEFKRILNWRWLAVLSIAGVLLIPMLIAQYQMYGLKAIRFFFWSQSFGRITGESPWRNDAGYFFLFHSYLWAFGPWTILWAYAYIKETFNFFKKETQVEYSLWGSFTLIFVTLSFSHYKLPHYIYIVVPLGAMLTAKHILTDYEKIKKWLPVAQFSMNYLIYALLCITILWLFPSHWVWYIVATLFFVFTQYQQWIKKQFLLSSVTTMIALHVVFSLHVYPTLLKYQSTHEIAKYVKQNMPKDYSFATFTFSNHSLDFYSNQIVPCIGSRGEVFEQVRKGKKLWLYIKKSDIPHLQAQNDITVKLIYENQYFMVANLSIAFLNPKTRMQTLESRCIVEVGLSA